jgi:ketosteroid isomerase-like protein
VTGNSGETQAGMRDDIRPHVRNYIAVFEQLTPGRIDELLSLCAEDMRFVDPFNDVRGRRRVRRVFEKMFEDAGDVHVHVRDWAVSGTTAYLRWSFAFRPRSSGKLWTIEGMSELHFDEAGVLRAHIDHWDAAGQLYEKLPYVGWLLRKIRGRLAA